jgi:hypothetical protein
VISPFGGKRQWSKKCVCYDMYLITVEGRFATLYRAADLGSSKAHCNLRSFITKGGI